MLNMVVKGVICYRCPETPPTFTLILDLKVNLVLEKPKGVMVEDVSQVVGMPKGFEAINIPDAVAVPQVLIIEETEQPPATPIGLHLEDTDYVAIPNGFIVEDI